MGNDKHIEIALRGTKAIAEWQKNNPNERLNLEGAPLRRADFVKANLSNAILKNADLEFADFRWADLINADLSDTKLIRADFHKADLSNASLKGANLSMANFEDAILNQANVTDSIFSNTNLFNTEITNVIGIDTIQHQAESIFDNAMLVKSRGLSEKFLKGIGFKNPYQVLVYKVFIGSPSDLVKERNIVRETIYQWNDLNSKKTKSVLLPVLWETHSTPEYGGDPQQIINHQLLENCHILICMFWSRIGTKTGDYESGTVEEIIRFHEAGNPIAIYFSEKALPQNHDRDQWEKLVGFKERLKGNALFGQFKTISDLKKQIDRHLTSIVDTIHNKRN